MLTLQRSLLKASHGALLFAAAQVFAGPVQSIRIGPIDASKADVTMVLAANTVKKCAGQYRGDLIAGKTVTKVNWAVSAPKANVLLTEPMSDTVKRFAKATDLHLGSFSLKASTVNADISVQSPLAFELRVLQATCEIKILGAVVAMGVKESFILAAGRPTLLRIPVTINHKALLSATGNVLAQRGKIDGKLSGLVRVRLPGGDADFPMEFPVLLKLM